MLASEATLGMPKDKNSVLSTMAVPMFNGQCFGKWAHWACCIVFHPYPDRGVVLPRLLGKQTWRLEWRRLRNRPSDNTTMLDSVGGLEIRVLYRPKDGRCRHGSVLGRTQPALACGGNSIATCGSRKYLRRRQAIACDGRWGRLPLGGADHRGSGELTKGLRVP